MSRLDTVPAQHERPSRLSPQPTGGVSIVGATLVEDMPARSCTDTTGFRGQSRSDKL